MSWRLHDRAARRAAPGALAVLIAACSATTVPNALFARCAEPELVTNVTGEARIIPCTVAALREAVADGGNYAVGCSSATTLTLDAPLAVARHTLLDGRDRLTLDGGGKVRAFDMTLAPGAPSGLTLTLRGMTVRHAASSANGGAILSAYRGRVNVDGVHFLENHALRGGAIGMKSGSTLVVTGSTFDANAAGDVGGGIYNLLSGLTIVNSAFDGNASVSSGAALYVDGASEGFTLPGGRPSGRVRVCGARFTGNHGHGQGGAAFTYVYSDALGGDEVLVERSAFTGNTVDLDADGHALGGAFRHGNGKLTLVDSVFSGNAAAQQGGALWTGDGGDVLVANTTFDANRAAGADGKGGLGGALMLLNKGSARLESVTIAGNHAGFQAGALQGSDRVTLRNSLVVNNTADNDGKGWTARVQCAASVAGDHVVQFPAPGGADDPLCVAGATVADPALGPLEDHGGGTLTRAVPADSAAVGAGVACMLDHDQRGVPRAGRCDLGAFQR